MAAKPSGVHILFIDDSEDMLEALALQYGLHPNIVVCGAFTNTGEAKLRLAEGDIDIVSVDVQLGSVDGLAVCQEIRQTYPSVYVIACSIEGDEASIERALRHGAHELVEKPVRYEDVTDIYARVRRHQM